MSLTSKRLQQPTSLARSFEVDDSTFGNGSTKEMMPVFGAPVKVDSSGDKLSSYAMEVLGDFPQGGLNLNLHLLPTKCPVNSVGEPSSRGSGTSQSNGAANVVRGAEIAANKPQSAAKPDKPAAVPTITSTPHGQPASNSASRTAPSASSNSTHPPAKAATGQPNGRKAASLAKAAPDKKRRNTNAPMSSSPPMQLFGVNQLPKKKPLKAPLRLTKSPLVNASQPPPAPVSGSNSNGKVKSFTEPQQIPSPQKTSHREKLRSPSKAQTPTAPRVTKARVQAIFEEMARHKNTTAVTRLDATPIKVVPGRTDASMVSVAMLAMVTPGAAESTDGVAEAQTTEPAIARSPQRQLFPAKQRKLSCSSSDSDSDSSGDDKSGSSSSDDSSSADEGSGKNSTGSGSSGSSSDSSSGSSSDSSSSSSSSSEDSKSSESDTSDNEDGAPTPTRSKPSIVAGRFAKVQRSKEPAPVAATAATKVPISPLTPQHLKPIAIVPPHQSVSDPLEDSAASSEVKADVVNDTKEPNSRHPSNEETAPLSPLFSQVSEDHLSEQLSILDSVLGSVGDPFSMQLDDLHAEQLHQELSYEELTQPVPAAVDAPPETPGPTNPVAVLSAQTLSNPGVIGSLSGPFQTPLACAPALEELAATKLTDGESDLSALLDDTDTRMDPLSLKTPLLPVCADRLPLEVVNGIQDLSQVVCATVEEEDVSAILEPAQTVPSSTDQGASKARSQPLLAPIDLSVTNIAESGLPRTSTPNIASQQYASDDSVADMALPCNISEVQSKRESAPSSSSEQPMLQIQDPVASEPHQSSKAFLIQDQVASEPHQSSKAFLATNGLADACLAIDPLLSSSGAEDQQNAMNTTTKTTDMPPEKATSLVVTDDCNPPATALAIADKQVQKSHVAGQCDSSLAEEPTTSAASKADSCGELSSKKLTQAATSTGHKAENVKPTSRKGSLSGEERRGSNSSESSLFHDLQGCSPKRLWSPKKTDLVLPSPRKHNSSPLPLSGSRQIESPRLARSALEGQRSARRSASSPTRVHSRGGGRRSPSPQYSHSQRHYSHSRRSMSPDDSRSRRTTGARSPRHRRRSISPEYSSRSRMNSPSRRSPSPSGRRSSYTSSSRRSRSPDRRRSQRSSPSRRTPRRSASPRRLHSRLSRSPRRSNSRRQRARRRSSTPLSSSPRRSRSPLSGSRTHSRRPAWSPLRSRDSRRTERRSPRRNDRNHHHATRDSEQTSFDEERSGRPVEPERLSDDKRLSNRPALGLGESGKGQHKDEKPTAVTDCQDTEKQFNNSQIQYNQKRPAGTLPAAAKEKRLHSFADWLAEAKRLKHRGDSVNVRNARAGLYIEASVCFIKAGHCLELSAVQADDKNRAVRIYTDTLHLLGYLNKIPEPPKKGMAIWKSSKELGAIAYRCQSILSCHIMMVVEDKFIQHHKILNDGLVQCKKLSINHLSCSSNNASPIASPGTPVTSSSQEALKVSRSLLSVSGSYSGLSIDKSPSMQPYSVQEGLSVCHDMKLTLDMLRCWKQSEELAQDCSTFFTELEKDSHIVSLTSPLVAILEWAYMGVARLRVR